MSLIEWNHELAVNVPFIDREHEELLVLINELHEAVWLRKARKTLTLSMIA